MDDIKLLIKKTEILKKEFPQVAGVLNAMVDVIVVQRRAVETLKRMLETGLACRICKKKGWDDLSKEYISTYGFCDLCDKLMADAAVENAE